MKKTIFVCFALGCLLFVSCSKDETSETVNQEDCIKSPLSAEQFGAVLDLLTDKLGNGTRAGSMNVTEDEMQTILEPCVEGGKQIQQQLMEKQYNNEAELDVILKEDIEAIEAMSEEHLAMLDFVIQVVNDDVPDSFYKERVEKALTWSKVRNCLAAAVGVANITYLTAQEAVSWRTAWQIAKAVAKRTTGGWIGVAIVMISFADCMFD